MILDPELAAVGGSLLLAILLGVRRDRRLRACEDCGRRILNDVKTCDCVTSLRKS